MSTARQKGFRAEDAGLKLLRRRGYKLLDRNWGTKGGELDLVMLHGKVLVFVEVRLRTSGMAGSALESVGHHKQQHLLRAARAYVATHPAHQHRACRFDVVAFDGDPPTPTVTENALTL